VIEGRGEVKRFLPCFSFLAVVLSGAAAAEFASPSDTTSGDAVFMYRPAVMNETPAPGPPGIIFKAEGITSGVLNAKGDIAFAAQLQHLDTHSVENGIFLLSGGNLVSVARAGSPAPFTGYYFRLLEIRSLAINDAGSVAFSTDIVPDPANPYSNVRYGAFIYQNGTFESVTPFDSSPTVAINNQGQLLIGSSDSLSFVSRYFTQTVAAKGQPVPDIAGATFDFFYGSSLNDRGDVAFSATYRIDAVDYFGIFLFSGNKVTTIVKQGDSFPETPGAKYGSAGFSGPDDNGAVYFTVETQPFVEVGVFEYLNGTTFPVLVQGQALSGRTVNRVSLGPVGPAGDLALVIGFQDDFRNFYQYIERNGVVSPLVLFTDDGHPADFSRPFVADINAAGEMVFGIDRGIYFARPVQPDSIYTDHFDDPSQSGRPLHWSTAWSNYGAGESIRYDSGGQDSYDGCCALRVHVAPGGGATFALSDQVPVQPNHLYRMTVQTRWASKGADDRLFFSVVQFDAAGNNGGFIEIGRTSGQWSWSQQSMLIITGQNTAAIRIRFGLVSGVESYADIDDLH
jgi:hypothetical protein